MKVSNELRVGIMFLTGLILLVLLVVTLTRWGKDRGTYTFKIHFTQAQGILDGAAVRVAGVQVGRVTAVGLDSASSHALVTVRVKDGVQLFKHYTYTIGVGGLVGERFIEITPSTGEGEKVSHGDEDVIGKSTPDINEAIIEADKLMEKFSKTADNLNAMIGDEETKQNLKMAVADLRTSAKHAAQFSGSLNQLIVRNQAAIDLIVANLNSVSCDIQRVSRSLSTQLSDTTVVKDMELATRNAVQITQRLESIAHAVDVLVGDESLKKNLHASVEHMKQATHELELLMVDAHAAADVLPEVTANLKAASADLPEITKPFRLVAPETAENVKQVSTRLLSASEEIDGVAQQVAGVSKALRMSEVDPDLREMVLFDGPENTRLDLNLDVRGPKTMMRVGMADLGKENDVNVQFGTRINDKAWLRYGVVQSRFGMGADYRVSPDLRLSGELFDPDNVRANALVDYRLKFLGPEWWLTSGLYDVFDQNTFGVGVTFRP